MPSFGQRITAGERANPFGRFAEWRIQCWRSHSPAPAAVQNDDDNVCADSVHHSLLLATTRTPWSVLWERTTGFEPATLTLARC